MAETEKQQAAPAETQAPGEAAKAGAYEVLRARLTDQCAKLRQSVEALNEKRKDVFGGMETTLAATSRINTEHSCVPRDIIHVGRKLIIGYDVFLGMKKETNVADVLAVYEFDGEEFKPQGLDFLADDQFVRDFQEVFRYFKNARLLQLRNTGTHVLMVFQTGATHTDIKVFRWEIRPGGQVRYLDNRGERDHVYPDQHDFKWTRATREMHVAGKHPHISINDEIFVECVGGDLTIKIEDNTESGEGIFAESVDDPDQALDDAETWFAVLDNLILLKIRPYSESEFRYIVYGKLPRKAVRIDSIAQACVQLPEGHGIIFPGGYCLQTGEYKTFNDDIEDMEFLKAVRSKNGEDVMYVFHHRVKGRYILLLYNLIRKEVATPIHSYGFSRYEDGKVVVLREKPNEATRSHPVQIWQTPFVGDDYELPFKADTYLGRIGNKDLVNGISDSLSLARQALEATPSAEVYEDLVRRAEETLDRYHWIDHEECGKLDALIRQVRDTGNAIIEEFEKVVRIRANTTKQIGEFSSELQKFLHSFSLDSLGTIDEHVDVLAQIRDRRGRLITLRELRYADLEKLKKLEEEMVARYNEVSERTVQFLLGPEALDPYTAKLDELAPQIEALAKATEVPPLEEQLDRLGEGLDLLAEIINNLKIDDATARTEIIEALSEVYAHVNRTKAKLEQRRKDMTGRELIAEFGAQFKLLGQSVSNYMGLCDEPGKCDEYLTKMLVQIEELESRFSDFEDFIEQIAEKRDEIYSAFSDRKQQLLDERQRKAGALARAADRIMAGIKRRASSFKTMDELNGYFASDPMVMKIRDQVENLGELGDSVKADDLSTQLKNAKQDAARGLRDKSEIFEDGENVIRFGQRRFNVNRQPLDLSLVLREERMCFHITGTDYYQPVADEAFQQTRPFWTQELPSENGTVYRAEFLAWSMLSDGEAGRHGLDLEEMEQAAATEDGLRKLIRSYIEERYDEGYERGVHDHDAERILRMALQMRRECGLLRYDPASRARAALFWGRLPDEAQRTRLHRKAQSLGRMEKVFDAHAAADELVVQISKQMAAFFESAGLPAPANGYARAAEYLFRELAIEKSHGFVRSPQAESLGNEFLKFLTDKRARKDFEADLESLQDDLAGAYDLAKTWLDAFLAEREAPDETVEAKGDEQEASSAADDEVVSTSSGDREARYAAEEVLASWLAGKSLRFATVQGVTVATIDELLGQHRRIKSGKLTLRFDEFMERVSHFATTVAPGYRAYLHRRKELLDFERDDLRLSEFEPRTLSTFVRNKLINEVYLPVIGDNLSKQMGEAGEAKRTDLMGLLLLISPPGYGKTTLMEYVASRLGLIFMKINGPALGHEVVSLDPNEAPNATARKEVEKLNLAFEMGNNVMIYVDDIQHTHSEFLQKFISLCDAQRKVEGVFRGRTRTYDLRGKKVCVVMAGNPYTESGARFQIPDMLANRADTYNLGDIIGGRQDLFELSYLENCLTSNVTLQPMVARDQKDFYKLVDMADGREVGEGDLGHDYSASELRDMVEVIKKLRDVQRTVLKVNQEYIRSAGQSDDFRTEPAFKLQGSYRDMNKMAARVLPVLSAEELERLIQDHYTSESQTLTTGSEHNLLKLAELRGTMNDAQAGRWAEIKKSFGRKQLLGGAGEDDKVGHVIAQLMAFNDNLDRIKNVIETAAGGKKQDDLARVLSETLERMAAQFQTATAEQQGQMQARLAEVLDSVRATMEARAKEPAPTVEIVNTLPKYYGNLYKHHIDVIQNVLVPMVKGLNHQIGETDEVKLALMEIVKQLRAQMGKHDDLSGARKQGSRIETETEDAVQDPPKG